MSRSWYILHTYTGYEGKIERSIKSLLETKEIDPNVVLDVKVPVEEVVEEQPEEVVEETPVEEVVEEQPEEVVEEQPEEVVEEVVEEPIEEVVEEVVSEPVAEEQPRKRRRMNLDQ